jgi:hypothetical protein
MLPEKIDSLAGDVNPLVLVLELPRQNSGLTVRVDELVAHNKALRCASPSARVKGKTHWQWAFGCADGLSRRCATEGVAVGSPAGAVHTRRGAAAGRPQTADPPAARVASGSGHNLPPALSATGRRSSLAVRGARAAAGDAGDRPAQQHAIRNLQWRTCRLSSRLG